MSDRAASNARRRFVVSVTAVAPAPVDPRVSLRAHLDAFAMLMAKIGGSAVYQLDDIDALMGQVDDDC